MTIQNIENKATTNPLDKEEKKEFVSSEVYNEEDKQYLDTYLKQRLQKGKSQKDQPYEEFDGNNYYQDYNDNIRIANTKLKRKVNDDDVIVSSGTIESKLDALLSHIHNLNFEPEILSYDKDNNRINDLGIALSDIMFMTEKMDGGDKTGDKEKKILRQRELLTQSAVFVQEEWLRTFETKKKLTQKYDGQFKNWKNWNEGLKLVFEGPSRTLLHGPNVYLGDITEYTMEKQPYFFVVIHQDYQIAKTKYGKFENWDFVHPGKIKESITEEQKTIYGNKFRLTEVKENQVEIILYQDQPNDEFQIIINGVMMLPIGFPLSAVSAGGKYNVAKQVFRPISEKFAYGKPFVRSGSIREISRLIDEMLKLFVLKTRKSITPPYVNVSNKVISRRALSPGRITMGIPPDALQAIGNEGQGVTSSEFSVLKELQDRVDKSTVSSQFQGQAGKSGQTATETNELALQAKLTLGLAIASVEFLEIKLGYLRLWNILDNWFEPLDNKVITVNDVREYVNTFRNVSRETAVEGEGLGERQIMISDQEPIASPEVIREMEVSEEKKTGKPVRKIILQPKGLKVARLTFYVVTTAKPKETSFLQKQEFREMLGDVISLMNLGSKPNLDGLEDEYSRIWNTSRSKIFEHNKADLAGVSEALAKNASASQGRANNNQFNVSGPSDSVAI